MRERTERIWNIVQTAFYGLLAALAVFVLITSFVENLVDITGICNSRNKVPTIGFVKSGSIRTHVGGNDVAAITECAFEILDYFVACSAT